MGPVTVWQHIARTRGGVDEDKIDNIRGMNSGRTYSDGATIIKGIQLQVSSWPFSVLPTVEEYTLSETVLEFDARYATTLQNIALWVEQEQAKPFLDPVEYVSVSMSEVSKGLLADMALSYLTAIKSAELAGETPDDPEERITDSNGQNHILRRSAMLQLINRASVRQKEIIQQAFDWTNQSLAAKATLLTESPVELPVIFPEPEEDETEPEE